MKIRISFVCAFALVFVLGCESDRVTYCDSCIGPSFSTTPDLAVEQLAQAWVERNQAICEQLLHDGFVFYFSQEDIDNNAVPGESWPRLEELQATDRIFNAGGSARSVISIHLDLSPIDSWSDQVAPEFAGTQKKTYFANMTVNYSNGDIGDVRGQQVFYVAPVDTTLEGETVTIYQLKYWRDLGFSEAPRRAGTESNSWGSLKASF